MLVMYNTDANNTNADKYDCDNENKNAVNYDIEHPKQKQMPNMTLTMTATANELPRQGVFSRIKTSFVDYFRSSQSEIDRHEFDIACTECKCIQCMCLNRCTFYNKIVDPSYYGYYHNVQLYRTILRIQS